jgi:hypothetical protein
MEFAKRFPGHGFRVQLMTAGRDPGAQRADKISFGLADQLTAHGQVRGKRRSRIAGLFTRQVLPVAGRANPGQIRAILQVGPDLWHGRNGRLVFDIFGGKRLAEKARREKNTADQGEFGIRNFIFRTFAMCMLL